MSIKTPIIRHVLSSASHVFENAICCSSKNLAVKFVIVPVTENCICTDDGFLRFPQTMTVQSAESRHLVCISLVKRVCENNKHRSVIPANVSSHASAAYNSVLSQDHGPSNSQRHVPTSERARSCFQSSSSLLLALSH